MTCAEHVRSQFHLLQIQKRRRQYISCVPWHGQQDHSPVFFATDVTGHFFLRQTLLRVALGRCNVTVCDLLVLQHQYAQYERHQTKTRGLANKPLACPPLLRPGQPPPTWAAALLQAKQAQTKSWVGMWDWEAGQPNRAWSCAGAVLASVPPAQGTVDRCHLCLAIIHTVDVPVSIVLLCWMQTPLVLALKMTVPHLPTSTVTFWCLQPPLNLPQPSCASWGTCVLHPEWRLISLPVRASCTGGFPFFAL